MGHTTPTSNFRNGSALGSVPKWQMSGACAQQYLLVALLLSWAATLSAQSVTITEYPVPTVNSDPALITQGPDGALWFTESLSNKIARIST